MNHIRISAASFLDYVRSTPRGCIDLVKQQRKMYTDPDSKGSVFYGPIRTALRRALNSPTPQQEFVRAVDDAGPSQYPHFIELERGFSRWWRSSRARSAGVKVSGAVRRIEGLNVTLHNLLGLRYANNETAVILPYLKDRPLSSDIANPVLRLLELEMAQLLPGAHPVILDVRQAQSFKLRKNTNRDDLDALLRGEAAKYATHWRAAAA